MQNPESNTFELNYNYCMGVIKSSRAQLIKAHIEDTYPRVAEILLIEGSLLPYVEPKLLQQVELECKYRTQGYPISGLSELGFRDIMEIIKEELEPLEKKELLNQFDLDSKGFIDTEFIN
jgi:hypothetical protein